MAKKCKMCGAEHDSCAEIRLTYAEGDTLIEPMCSNACLAQAIVMHSQASLMAAIKRDNPGLYDKLTAKMRELSEELDAKTPSSN